VKPKVVPAALPPEPEKVVKPEAGEFSSSRIFEYV
jgi:hypothetical protein